MNTMVTFRTDEKLKNEASHIFDSLGMSLSTAVFNKISLNDKG